MTRWIFVLALVMQTHFAASYLVPLDEESRREFGGALRWAWPWAHGDSGLLGEISEAGTPIVGLFLAMAAGAVLLTSALATAGWWIPHDWWRPLATAGAGLLLVLMALFLGPTKLLPIAFAAATLYVAVAAPVWVADD